MKVDHSVEIKRENQCEAGSEGRDSGKSSWVERENSCRIERMCGRRDNCLMMKGRVITQTEKTERDTSYS